jgi:hypothetical protein
MKTPPLLLLGTLLFWGWQTGFLLAGAVMGVLLESARFIRFRWELDDTDFNRIWGFCSVLNVVLAVYVFTHGGAGGGLNETSPDIHTGVTPSSTILTATRFLRWLPMTTFAFIAAQVFNIRESAPVAATSLLLRWRQRRGGGTLAHRYLNVSYPYFMVCLFSAAIHPNPGTWVFFWGQSVLVAWALWPLRPMRFGKFIWLGAMIAVLGLGLSGLAGIGLAQRMLQNLNSQWMERFLRSRTDPLVSVTRMGRIGELKLSARIVVRVEPRDAGWVPVYLREASYGDYRPQLSTWYAGGQIREFQLLQPEPDNTSWTLVPGAKHPHAANIACYLNGWSRDLDAPEGLLPLPGDCARLEKVAATAVLRKNNYGAVLAAGPGLLAFDAKFGGGASPDAPPDLHSTNHNDLSVPVEEIPALQRVVAWINLSADASRDQKLRAVGNFFTEQFTYSTWQGADKKPTSTASPLTRFLLDSRSGHCEYFASATVLLLRQLNIPARYAVGYYVHEARGSGYIVRERDAHAWCLVWNEVRRRWDDFDTTPASWMEVERRRTEGGEWFADVFGWIRFQFARLRWGQARFQQYIYWALIPVLLVLLYHIIFRRKGRLRALGSKSGAEAALPWPGLDSEFYSLERRLAELGVARQPGESLSEWLERALTAPALAALRESIQALLRLHYRHRFDPHGLNAAERETLRRNVLEILEKLSEPV